MVRVLQSQNNSVPTNSKQQYSSNINKIAVAAAVVAVVHAADSSIISCARGNASMTFLFLAQHEKRMIPGIYLLVRVRMQFSA